MNKELLNRIEDLEKKQNYTEVLKECEEAIKQTPHIDLVINQNLFFYQCKALAALDKWHEAIAICETRLALLKERRNLYSRYEQCEYTEEEAKAFQFLNGKESELYNMAWNSEYRRLESEERDIKETLKLAKMTKKERERNYPIRQLQLACT